MGNLDLDALFKTSPPGFGHEMLQYFAFDREYLNMNHGSYGSVPVPVSSAADKISLKIDSNPDYFHRIGYQSQLMDVRRRLAQLIGANTDEVVLVANATAGVNTILRNIEWEHGDTIITLSTSYISVDRTVQYIGDIPPYPTISKFVLQFPTTHDEIISGFKDYLATIPVISGKKRVAIIDSIISNPGALLPWKELVEICREQGILSIVDGAHSIGHETDINLSEAKPDFWVSNCYKWLYTKRGCAILYVPMRNQHMIKSAVPTSSSYTTPADRNDPNFVIQFETNGTIDVTSYLSVGPALDFRNWLGGEAKINEYCHNMAVKGGKRLAEILGTRVMDPDGSLTLNMVNVELPFPSHIKPSDEIELKFNTKLLVEHKAYAAYFYRSNRWWTRCSAQIWTEIEDFEKIGRLWLTVCEEVLQELGSSSAK